MTTTNHSALSAETTALLQRPTEGQIHFSDVFAEVVAHDDSTWWRQTDFDSGLTVRAESEGFSGVTEIPIGYRPWLANYGLVLVDDLVHERNGRLGKLDVTGEDLHPDLRRELVASQGAVVAVANYAPRDDANTKGGDQNGSDFYLAITTSGLEVVTTPLEFLGDLNARHRIVALYRVPNEGNPEFRDDEQFRSARVARVRRHPSNLEPVFEFGNSHDVAQSKARGDFPAIIPTDQRTGKIAWIDAFGAVKLQLATMEGFDTLAVGRAAAVAIRSDGQEYEIGVTRTTSLKAAPLGKLAVYANCSDPRDQHSTTGFVECVVRVNGNPRTSTQTAIFKLLERIPDLDPATAEVELITS